MGTLLVGERQCSQLPVQEPRTVPQICQYSTVDLWQELGGAAASVSTRTLQLTTAAAVQQANSDDDIPDDLELPTDAQATVMLLRDTLYPDPAAAAAAATAAKQTRHAKRSKAAPGPSKAAAAAVVAAAAVATAARRLPPIVLKTQLYTVLADRTAVDLDVEELRRQGRIRLFKLAIGRSTMQVATNFNVSETSKLICPQHAAFSSAQAGYLLL